MDNNEDKYIKDIFKKDDLISKNADDIFTKFLNGELKENEDASSNEEKVVNINEAREKKKNKSKKKAFSAVASVAVLFIAVNTYASTQGYGNIFFMIRDLINNQDIVIENKEDILSDRDITISYESIDITNDLKIQINRLVIEENTATLTVYFDECSNQDIQDRPYSYKVYDITENKNLLAEGKTKVVTDEIVKKYPGSGYTEEIILNNFKNTTNVLVLDVFNEDGESLVSLEIDIENKKIDVISKKEVAFEKISEVELKEVLSNYVALNYFNDNSDRIVNGTEEENNNRLLAELGVRMVYDKLWYENTNTSLLDAGDINKVNVALKEITGESIEEPLDLPDNDFLFYNKEKDIYQFDNGDSFLVPGLCLDVTDITYKNGIYEVTCIYCYPGSAYENSDIVNMAQYRTILKLKINENYEYAKYQIVNIDDISSIKIKDSDKVTGDVTNEISNTTTNTTANIIASTNTNTVTNTTVINATNNNTNTNATVNIYGNTYEKELVDFLKYMVRINFFEDLDSVTKYFTVTEYQNEMKILAALELSGKDILSYEEYSQIQKELTGDSTQRLDSSHIVIKNQDEGYSYISKNYQSKAELYRIVNIKKENGIYYAKVIYRQISGDDRMFMTTVAYKENTNYKYSKYQCINSSNLQRKTYIIDDQDVTNDSFANSVSWTTTGTVRINIPYPKHFTLITGGDLTIDGDELPGTFSIGMKGNVHAYTVDGVSAGEAEMTVRSYLPEELSSNDLKAYAKTVAERYNIAYSNETFENATIYYSADKEELMELDGNAVSSTDYEHKYYCLIRSYNGSYRGYIIEIEVRNPNERTENYKDVILGGLRIYNY